MSENGFNYSSPAFLEKSKAPGFWDYTRACARGVNLFFKIRQTRHELERLPDHILSDIGVERGRIQHVAETRRRTDKDLAA